MCSFWMCSQRQGEKLTKLQSWNISITNISFVKRAEQYKGRYDVRLSVLLMKCVLKFAADCKVRHIQNWL